MWVSLIIVILPYAASRYGQGVVASPRVSEDSR